jgi:hypothetical protein
MAYSPATKADLAKGYPTPGWNEISSTSQPSLARSPHQGSATLLPGSTQQTSSYTAATTAAAKAQCQDSGSIPSSAAAAAAAAAAGSARTPGIAQGSTAWSSALQQLFSSPGSEKHKWRVILPNGDRVGPFSSGDMVGWLAGAGRAPKGVGGAEARAVEADQGVLMVCGIVGYDYSAQKLPGGWDATCRPLVVIVQKRMTCHTYIRLHCKELPAPCHLHGHNGTLGVLCPSSLHLSVLKCAIKLQWYSGDNVGGPWIACMQSHMLYGRCVTDACRIQILQAPDIPAARCSSRHALQPSHQSRPSQGLPHTRLELTSSSSSSTWW